MWAVGDEELTPLVPVGVGVDGLALAGFWAGFWAGFAGLAVLDVAALGGNDSLELLELAGVSPPAADLLNSARCVRNSTSLPRIAASIGAGASVALAAADVLPLVPVTPPVPVPDVPTL
jgi:hypothetical protein